MATRCCFAYDVVIVNSCVASEGALGDITPSRKMSYSCVSVSGGENVREECRAALLAAYSDIPLDLFRYKNMTAIGVGQYWAFETFCVIYPSPFQPSYILLYIRR